MSWHFSQALVAASSGVNSLDGGPSVPSKSKLAPAPNSRLVRMTAASKRSLYGTMFAPLPSATEPCDQPSALFAANAIDSSSQADFPAKTLAAPEMVRESTVRGLVFGVSKPESLARFDPLTSSWRTHQHSLFGGGFELLETLPAWGMIVAGELYQLPMPSGLMAHRALITSESGFGLSERVPTPRASDGEKCSGPHNGSPDTLPSYVKAVPRVPTPRKIDGRSATENTTDGCLIRGFEKEGGTNLAEYMQMSQRRLLPVPRVPTPMKSDADKWNNMTAEERIAKGQFVRLQNYLSTPEARVGGSLNPAWVEWLMGWPIGWTDCMAPVTVKFREWCISHGIS